MKTDVTIHDQFPTGFTPYWTKDKQPEIVLLSSSQEELRNDMLDHVADLDVAPEDSEETIGLLETLIESSGRLHDLKPIEKPLDLRVPVYPMEMMNNNSELLWTEAKRLCSILELDRSIILQRKFEQFKPIEFSEEQAVELAHQRIIGRLHLLMRDLPRSIQVQHFLNSTEASLRASFQRYGCLMMMTQNYKWDFETFEREIALLSLESLLEAP